MPYSLLLKLNIGPSAFTVCYMPSDSGILGLIPGRSRYPPQLHRLYTAIRSNQSPIQYVAWSSTFEKSNKYAKLNTHVHLVPQLKGVELYLHFPMRLHKMVLN
jgi:hypothetical protein